jgi:Ser-tRNA(Ala) deacylase AlaX
MATKLLYLDEFDVNDCEAVVTVAAQAEDARNVIELDQTCFYPRGGGQDWDTGTIKGDGTEFVVDEVRLDENGVVKHIGTYKNGGEFAVGQEVRCGVDVERRNANTRLHSAGHLLDMAMIAIAPDWVPGKGAHYLHMSFVEYMVPDGVTNETANEAFVASVQTEIDALLQSEYQNKILFIPKEEMGTYCRHVPDNIPTNKPSRIVLYADDFGIPCGGTHVKQVKDIGRLQVTKIKIKKGVAKVSYAVEGIN